MCILQRAKPEAIPRNSCRVGLEISNGHILTVSLFFFFFFLAALGLRCCVWAFSSCSEQGLLCVKVCRLLIAVASLVAEHGL